RMTLISPASATRPEALTIELETWPLLMPIETVWPLPHSELEAAMWTLHVPSKEVEAAATGVANGEARANAALAAIKVFLEHPMTRPLRASMQGQSRLVASNAVMIVTSRGCA